MSGAPRSRPRGRAWRASFIRTHRLRPQATVRLLSPAPGGVACSQLERSPARCATSALRYLSPQVNGQLGSEGPCRFPPDRKSDDWNPGPMVESYPAREGVGNRLRWRCTKDPLRNVIAPASLDLARAAEVGKGPRSPVLGDDHTGQSKRIRMDTYSHREPQFRVCRRAITGPQLIEKSPQPAPAVRRPLCASRRPPSAARRSRRGRAASLPSARGSTARALPAKRARRSL
jgi:hypothetical protein